jgi:hypothetical protein
MWRRLSAADGPRACCGHRTFHVLTPVHMFSDATAAVPRYFSEQTKTELKIDLMWNWFEDAFRIY